MTLPHPSHVHSNTQEPSGDAPSHALVLSLAKVRDTLSQTIDKDVAALWRLLDSSARSAPHPDLEVERQAFDASAQTLGQLLSNLTQRLEPETRQGLMPQLQTARHLSPEATLDLALDTTPEGLKFCEQSIGLNAAMLYHLIFEGREATQIAVAKRPDLLSEHVDALISRPSFLVAYQVLKNRAIHLTPSQIETLTHLSLRHTALRSPLVSRPELGELDALNLSTVVSTELQSGLKQRFPNLDMAYPQTVGMAQHLKPELDHTGTPFLVNCLSRGLLPAYARGVAKRFGLHYEPLLCALQSPSFVPLALTLAALGVDRAAFNGLLRKRSLKADPEALEGRERLTRAIFALTPQEAEARLKANPDFGPDFFKANAQDIG